MLSSPRRALCKRRIILPTGLKYQRARFHRSATFLRDGHGTKDPRLSNVDNLIEDEFAVLKSSYQAPKNPIILAHGLLGFDELRPAGNSLPGIEYWYGIRQALSAKGVEVIVSAVPPSGSIEARAARLAEAIERQAHGKAVNIIAYVDEQLLLAFRGFQLTLVIGIAWGLDSRYMISQLRPANVKCLSLTTIATPHRGSAFADYMFQWVGMTNLPKIYKALEFFGVETGAFKQLTREYMSESFNPRTPDVDGVRYYSYGATFRPHLLSVFRKSHNIIEPIEGPNDGMVSVESSRWGEYKGTLDQVSHLDLINWTNRLRWYFWGLTGKKRNFNAIAFYLSISDMLAKEGL